MTATTYTAASTRGTALTAYVAAARTTYDRWRTYRRTLNELSMLSDRDLDDLGIHRGDVERIARDSAYGL